MSKLLAVLIVTLSVTLLAAPVSAQSYYRAVMDGSQETPPNSSPGHGIACFFLDGDGLLYYQISYFGLWGVETRSHIHGPAPPGVSSRYRYILLMGNPKCGAVGPLTLAEIGYLNDSLLYVNIHTPNASQGEIRGQILPVDGECTVPIRPTTWGRIKALYRTP